MSHFNYFVILMTVVSLPEKKSDGSAKNAEAS